MYDRNAKYIQFSAGLSALLLILTVAPVGATPLPEGIGVITAVQGQVTMAHARAESAVPAKIDDDVLFKDIIETQKESRTKALFDDETLLTVGEHSRVEISEHIYDPSQNRRSMVVKLVRGTLRALISKVFDGSGSKFEIHTPTAVAAARGTYFVVWVQGDLSGVVNIGSSGRVDFTSAGQSVSLAPGQFSVAPVGATPTLPAVFANGGDFTPSGLSRTTPGRSGTTPGRSGTTPGQSGLTPSQGAPPPGKVGATPGQSGTAPGKSGITPGQGIQTGGPQVGSQDLSLLASVRAAIGGTELRDIPRAVSAKSAVPAIPAIPGGQGSPATPALRAAPAVPASPAAPAVPATPPPVISGAFPGKPPCGTPPCGGPSGGGPPGGGPPGGGPLGGPKK
jgi:hypothetical protein